ncbi:MAG: cupin domain-containing protein [Deltaproteobacteria bacterium]
MQHKDVFEEKVFNDKDVNVVTNIKTERLAQVTYYMKAGQTLDYHRHPEGDQVFFTHEGTGVCYAEEGKEEAVRLKPGVIVLAPKGVWHKLVASTDLIVSAATTQPAGFEKR